MTGSDWGISNPHSGRRSDMAQAIVNANQVLQLKACAATAVRQFSGINNGMMYRTGSWESWRTVLHASRHVSGLISAEGCAHFEIDFAIVLRISSSDSGSENSPFFASTRVNEIGRASCRERV